MMETSRILIMAMGGLLATLPLVASAVQQPHTGETLSAKSAKRFKLPDQPVVNDTGINILLDFAHEAQFHMMWEWPGAMRESGYRVCGSHASLESVLKEGGVSRIRVPDGKRRPFAWWPNPKYNVVVSYQNDPTSQDYVSAEAAALIKFVKAGGGLVLSGAPTNDEKKLAGYPLAKLAALFGAKMTTDSATVDGMRGAVWNIDSEWKALCSDPNGKVLSAWRPYGKGRVVVLGQSQFMSWDEKAPAGSPTSYAVRKKAIAEVVKLAAEGMKPVGGTRALPLGDEGVGGPIYPEMEEIVQGAVTYYAKNQFPRVLEAVRKDMPRVDKQVRAWAPAPAPKDPMYLILASGYGGGWAVNIYEPKEVGIIAPDPDEILSILAHEVAHTCYAGPPNDKGMGAGQLPETFSEAHAGWFQRKANTWLHGTYSGHDANGLLKFDKDGTKFDLANCKDAAYGQAWTKLWWLWQKLDEKYGPTWYTRWLWVKNMRWADTPNKELTWDEVVEDMSIAVGEDLFPHMRKIGTTLTKERFPEATFLGTKLTLPVAVVSMDKAGPAITTPIGDYKKPLR